MWFCETCGTYGKDTKPRGHEGCANPSIVQGPQDPDRRDMCECGTCRGAGWAWEYDYTTRTETGRRVRCDACLGKGWVGNEDFKRQRKQLDDLYKRVWSAEPSGSLADAELDRLIRAYGMAERKYGSGIPNNPHYADYAEADARYIELLEYLFMRK